MISGRRIGTPAHQEREMVNSRKMSRRDGKSLRLTPTFFLPLEGEDRKRWDDAEGTEGKKLAIDARAFLA
jgi:hypothetical protein